VKDNNGFTPLMLAEGYGYKDILELLLSTGKVYVNAKDKNGLTPLTLAAEYGHIDIVELLKGF
jgi:ankyrin repeat protein